MSDVPPRDDDRDALLRRVQQAVGALFDIEEEIGRGGMAVVYRARDVRLRRKVALKVLPPELAFREEVKRRFLREAQMAAQLSHPHIVPIFAVDELDGIVYFAMGLVEGEPLARQLAREPRPPVDVIRRLLGEVADALAYAHAHGVVHRDVKPDNILVERATGRALVSDFGIARAAEGDGRLTVTGNAVGTPAYMSPEQAMGERDVDGRSDIYSLGIVGYQMLAGELPFQASNTPAMLMKHISERPRPLHERCADAPQNLVDAIERAMAKGRGERWPDALAFRSAVSADAPVNPSSRDGDAAQAGSHVRDDEAGDRGFGADLALRINGRVLGSIGVVARERDHGTPPAPAVAAQPYPRFPALPPNWMFRADTREYGREALREWREQQRLWRERQRARPLEPATMTRRELRRARREGLLGPMTPEERVRRVQRSAVSFATTSAFLFGLNMLTYPRFPWFIFPMLGMGVGLVSRVASLWVDGISVGKIFRRQPHVVQVLPSERSRGAEAAPRAGDARRPRASDADLAGVPREVLEGPHGRTVRDAAEAKAMILDVLAKLSPADRQMLPEIQPTVDALVERVRSLAQGLSQLEADASAAEIARLERRIADTRSAGAEVPDRERRLQLLERQHTTLKDLASRRDAVAQQLESASMVLQTIKLDLLKLRSSGLDARLDASTGATQEARALSTDIGRVIEAANEVRKL